MTINQVSIRTEYSHYMVITQSKCLIHLLNNWNTVVMVTSSLEEDGLGIMLSIIASVPRFAISGAASLYDGKHKQL